MGNLFSNKTYDTLKWVVNIFLPALATFMGVIFAALSYENADVVLTIMAGFITFMGSLLAVSNHQYNKQEDAKMSEPDAEA